MTLLALLLACGPSADEPAAVSWDHAACDECGMLIGDPKFAAQLETKDGERIFFDDPACLFRYVAAHTPSISHGWFADSTASEVTWLDWHQVGFVPSAGAPMDGGLAAVPALTDGAMNFAAASALALAPHGETP